MMDLLITSTCLFPYNRYTEELTPAYKFSTIKLDFIVSDDALRYFKSVDDREIEKFDPKLLGYLSHSLGFYPLGKAIHCDNNERCLSDRGGKGPMMSNPQFAKGIGLRIRVKLIDDFCFNVSFS